MGNIGRKRRGLPKAIETTDLVTNQQEVTSLETTVGAQENGRQKRSKIVEGAFDGM
jgi:hypothetical protein